VTFLSRSILCYIIIILFILDYIINFQLYIIKFVSVYIFYFRLKLLINKADVMAFIKGNKQVARCGFSNQLIQILNQTG